jgi:hypothetical protein
MLVSNYAVGSTGGHADQDPIPPHKLPLAGPLQGVCNGPEECRAAVRHAITLLMGVPGRNIGAFLPMSCPQ